MTPDSVFLRNEISRSLRINLHEILLDSALYRRWEFPVRSSGTPSEYCLGKGSGSCPPAPASGGASVSWTIPSRDSLPLQDFNPAPCIRRQIAHGSDGAPEVSRWIPLILRSSGGGADPE
jgi:hypothetical protein